MTKKVNNRGTSRQVVNTTLATNEQNDVKFNYNTTLAARPDFSQTFSVPGYMKFDSSSAMPVEFHATRRGGHGSPYEPLLPLPSGANLTRTSKKIHVRGFSADVTVSMPEFRKRLLADMVELYRWSYEQERCTENMNIINNIKNDLKEWK